MRHTGCLSRDDPFLCTVITDGNDKAALGILLLAATVPHQTPAEKAVGSSPFWGGHRIYVDEVFLAITEIPLPTSTAITCIYSPFS